mgnify:CR=1 FL=1
MEADLSKENFFFGIPCYDGLIHINTMVGLIDTVNNLHTLGVPHSINAVTGGALIDLNRNDIVDKFLKSDATILVFIDADISFTWEQMQRLLVYSTQYELICGSYPTRTEPCRFLVKPSKPELNEDGLLPIDHIGMGFVAIHRNVFNKLTPETYDTDTQKQQKAYFRLTIENGMYVGEDIYFFRRCKEKGIQAYVDPGIELGHIGLKTFNTPFHFALNKYLT